MSIFLCRLAVESKSNKFRCGRHKSQSISQPPKERRGLENISLSFSAHTLPSFLRRCYVSPPFSQHLIYTKETTPFHFSSYSATFKEEKNRKSFSFWPSSLIYFFSPLADSSQRSKMVRVYYFKTCIWHCRENIISHRFLFPRPLSTLCQSCCYTLH